MIETLINQASADGVTVELTDSSVKVRGEQTAIEKWLPVLRPRKPELIEALRARAVEDALKSRAVLLVLDSTGDRVWLCADAEDAAKLGDVGGDSIVTRDEIRVLAAIREPEIRNELMGFKRELRGAFRAQDR